MTSHVISVFIFIIVFISGILIGKLFSDLKNKNKTIKLEEKIHQFLFQIEDFKAQSNNILSIKKEELIEAKSSMQKQLERTETEREEIRKQKDTLNTELAIKNSEFQNLKQKNSEQKAEVEKLQEKFQKEFENLANKILDQKSEKFTSINK